MKEILKTNLFLFLGILAGIIVSMMIVRGSYGLSVVDWPTLAHLLIGCLIAFSLYLLGSWLWRRRKGPAPNSGTPK